MTRDSELGTVDAEAGTTQFRDIEVGNRPGQSGGDAEAEAALIFHRPTLPHAVHRGRCGAGTGGSSGAGTCRVLPPPLGLVRVAGQVEQAGEDQLAAGIDILAGQHRAQPATLTRPRQGRAVEAGSALDEDRFPGPDQRPPEILMTVYLVDP